MLYAFRPMDFIRGILSSSFFKGESSFFLENGSMLLEEFVTHWNGRSEIPIRNFSAKELAKAIGNFHVDDVLYQDVFYKIHQGYFEKRPVLVKKYVELTWTRASRMKLKQLIARDIVISSQMSVHKNVLKVIGYCLDFEYPALVYQCPEASDLTHPLFYTEELNLTWKNRLSVASDIANVLAYLHLAFPTPIIHRDLKLRHVVIDRYGSAKISDFSSCVSLPPGKSQVEDDLIWMYEYIDPNYYMTGLLAEKTDVYNMGLILVELLTGKNHWRIEYIEENFSSLFEFLRSYTEDDKVKDIVNGNIVMEGETGQDEQFRAFAALALRCLAQECNDRPTMVDIVKELGKIRGLGCSSSM